MKNNNHTSLAIEEGAGNHQTDNSATPKSLYLEGVRAPSKFIDIGNRKILWENWFMRNKRNIKGINNRDSKIILKYLKDMSIGLNVSKSHKLACRSPSRLLGLAYSMISLSKISINAFQKSLGYLAKTDVHKLFWGLREGTITQPNGKPYSKSSAEKLCATFISFINWRIKHEYFTHGRRIDNVVEFLNSYSTYENVFCYFSKKQLERVLSRFEFNERVLLLLLFDSGIRAPIELVNLKGRNITYENKRTMLNVEVFKSTSFSRKFNLTFCSNQIKKYLKRNNVKEDDTLFLINEKSIRRLNRKMQRVFSGEFGEKNIGGKPYNKITLYDFRHSSCCHYRGLNVNLDKLLYRFGWTSIKKANYYSKFINHNGIITDKELKGSLS